MKLFLILVFTAFLNSGYSQKWIYNEGTSDFDGKYRTSYITGSGGQFPYQKPKLFVNYFFQNQNLNIYISGAGYAGCDDKSILFKFNNDDEIYSMRGTANNDAEDWFIGSVKGSLSMPQLLSKMKSHSRMSVRLSSDCGQSDYSFSLAGSTVALDYVAKEYLESEIENEVIRKAEEVIEKAIQQKVLVFKTGEKIKALSDHDCSVFKRASLSSLYKSLEKGEQIVVSYFDDEYSILHSAESLNIGQEVFYVTRACFKNSSIELISN